MSVTEVFYLYTNVIYNLMCFSCKKWKDMLAFSVFLLEITSFSEYF